MIPRQAKGKLLIPVGWNELSVRKVEEKKTSNGRRMVVVTAYLKPAKTLYGKDMDCKYSFNKIFLYHIEGDGVVNTWWHRMSTMPNDALDQLHSFKGKKFYGLVRHVEKHLVKDGERVEYEGEEKTCWQAELVRVMSIRSTPPEVDMSTLVSPIDNPLKRFMNANVREFVEAFDLEFDHFEPYFEEYGA